jgi:hypothetical protein
MAAPKRLKFRPTNSSTALVIMSLRTGGAVVCKDAVCDWAHTPASNSQLQFTPRRSLQFSQLQSAVGPLGLLSFTSPTGTSFQRRKFPFLASRNVPVPKRLTYALHLLISSVPELCPLAD